MADITVVNDTGELYNVINQKKSEGYLESELTIISKSKLHLNDLHDSEISLISTSGTFSDRMTKLLTGEDGEHAVLSRYNLAPDELEKYKQLILDDKMLVVAVRDIKKCMKIIQLMKRLILHILLKHLKVPKLSYHTEFKMRLLYCLI